jgi:hypothetical protein
MLLKLRLLVSLTLFLSLFHLANAQKVAFWDNVDFDKNTVIVCFPSGSNPDQNKELAFIVRTQNDFNQMKKDWVFEEKSFGKKPDNSLAIYRVKDKMGEWIGTIYPGINKLTNIEASFVFDTVKLVELAKRHPFHFLRKTEFFNSREEYRAQYNKEILERKFLFSFGPGTWDGSFKITVSSSDSVHTPVAAINILTSKLNAFASPDSYSLRYELSADNRDYNKSFKITVDCVKSVYDQYNDATYLKSEWKGDQLFLTSFWEN